MKAIYKYFIVLMAVLAFVPKANAQYVESNGIALNKTVTGPVNGQYKITLEAFTTGTVTITDGIAPADIVLVLDYSQSMQSRIASLREAVRYFVEIINDSNDDVIADDNGKHRVAIVIYSAGVRENTGFVPVEDVNDELFDTALSTGTGSGTAMAAALARIKEQADANAYIDRKEGDITIQNSKRSKIVVFFTDGKPGGAGTNPYGEEAQGTLCITSANSIKNTYDGVVYSVGLFSSNTSRQGEESTFLSWVSSDYTDKTTYASSRPSDGWVSVSDTYSFLVTNQDKLKDVFEQIGGEAGQSGASLGESSTVTVDVLSASFTLPKNADKSSITTYTAKCIDAERDSDGNIITNAEGKVKTFLFDSPVATAGSELFNGVAVDDSEFDNDIISVKGFDYETHFCAAKKEGDEFTGEFVGYKLIIEIPIIINPESVGGPNTATNDPKSGVYLTDDEGHRLPNPALAFNQPTVPVPVNLVIRKLGLNKGESAKFVLQRTDAYDASGKLIEVSQATWTNFESSATWTPLTTFVLTGDGNAYVEHSITGLSDRYYYRILEEDGTMVENANWSWSYTGSAMTYTNSYQQLKNPFIFNNTKGETTRKHAESVVTNIFKAGKKPVTIDSREFLSNTSSTTTKAK